MRGRKRKVEHMTIHPDARGKIVVPDHIQGLARKVYRTVVRHLIALDRWHPGFAPVMESYAMAVADRAVAREHIEQDGHIVETAKGPAISPWVRIYKEADATVLRICAECGLTPVAMARIVGAHKEQRVAVTLSDGSDDDLYLENKNNAGT